MIKDAHLRIIFIPLLGISLPLISGIITYRLYTVPELLVANVFFITTSLAIWVGCNWIHGKLRLLYAPLSNPFSKIATVSVVSGLYGACIGCISTLIWMEFSRETFSWTGFWRFTILCILAVIVFTLLYEILFLSKERELDTRRVRQLDRARSQAELQALTSELDPHFIFNSLNTMNHLIVHNPAQAHLFNNKLAQVYKYMLINRARELISLEDELEFIENYFFLLQIRHDNKLQLKAELGEHYDKVRIPPCALQILMENAIKHNEFTDANPLQIRIVMNGQFLKVSNNVKPKPYSVNSTGIGLRNLSCRYMIICQKDIVIEDTRENFTVKLPLIK
ncbi:MAG TPA: histidine kinase [Chitinophagaceae bacterium]|nr:histidine kinase [Chitinophagaceae bacterium]